MACVGVTDAQKVLVHGLITNYVHGYKYEAHQAAKRLTKAGIIYLFVDAPTWALQSPDLNVRAYYTNHIIHKDLQQFVGNTIQGYNNEYNG